MNTVDKSPRFTIPESVWEDWTDDGEMGAPGSRLGTSIVINSTYFHVEAIEVGLNGNSIQSAVDPRWEDSFDAYYNAAGGDGAVDTVTINGREYAVFISPFC